MSEEETKKVNTEAATEVVPSPAAPVVPEAEAPTPAAPVPEPEVPVVEVSKDETEEKSVVTEEKSVEEAAKPVATPATKKSGRFFALWSKSKKKDSAVKTETPELAAVPEPTAVPEPETPVVEAPKEEIEVKLVVPATETEEKPEDTTTPAVLDAKKSGHFFKRPSLSWKKSPQKSDTVETPATPAVPEAEPELPVVVEAPKDEIEEKSVIVPACKEKTEDSKPDVEADVADTKKSGGFLKLGSIKWPKTKKKESLESLPSALVEESEATVTKSLKVEVDKKSIVPVEEEKVDDSKPVVVDDAKKGGSFFQLSSISWKKKQTKESSEETIEEEKIDEDANQDIVLTKAASEKTLTLIQAWEASEKAKAENKAEKELSIIVSDENIKQAAVEDELKQFEEKLERSKARYIKKLKNREALNHKVAEKKRASVEAKRAEELLIAEETAAKYRATGSAPKKLLLGYF